MAQKLSEQIMTIERALGERMITHALIVVRSWLNELGENNPYEKAYADINAQYEDIFTNWLTSDDPKREETLDALTGDTYRLVDAVYVDIRLRRGLSPQVHGFGKDSAQSVMHYFSYCLQFRDEDWEWLHDIIYDTDQAATALMAVGALTKNVRECFNEQALYAFIDGIGSDNEVVAEQCLANSMLLLAHYDVRIDFFPELQKAFADAILEMDDEGEQAFQTLCAIVRSAKKSWIEEYKSGELTLDDLPQESRSLLELTGSKDDLSGIMSWMPHSEQEYMQGLVQVLPDTWVYNFFTEDSPERATHLAVIYLSIGYMDMLWENVDVAAKWLVTHLREGKATAQDYINYGHCLLLQGDKMMAYENYRLARQMCRNPKEFFNLFRPDRRALVDHGIPLEVVYLLEDQLINN